MSAARVPLREAADSMAKASTPEPFSTSRTSNWVARAGGLPPYIQHVAHDLVEAGHPESQAIQMAIGIIKRWAKATPSGGEKHVDPTTVAAAQKALAQWEAMKARSKLHSSLEPASWEIRQAARVLQEAALSRLVVAEQRLGHEAMLALLDGSALLEAASTGWSPTLKRVASASGETERHEVMDGDQSVGTVCQQPGYGTNGPRFSARAVNGERIAGDAGSRPAAVEALRKHLEEAPGRVSTHKGKFLVARPSYSGQTTYTEFPSEGAARHAAGLPAAPSSPERASQVEQLGEMLRCDLLSTAGVLPVGMSGLVEAAAPVPLGAR